MNPLTSVKATIASGFILALIVAFFFKTGTFNVVELSVWLHVIAGITWIGLLYYFNFVQVPAMGAALADKDGPGPAAIGKYVAPRALLWFRMAAAVTWLTGMWALGANVGNAFTFASGFEVIGLGAWLGTIMLFNVWVFIWPNQQKILGMKSASADEIAKAKVTALYASRINVILSVPMLFCMTAYGHGGNLF